MANDDRTLADQRRRALDRYRRLADILKQLEGVGVSAAAPAHREVRKLVGEALGAFEYYDQQFLVDETLALRKRKERA